ncbi:MAG: hypothetical protein KDK50_04015 [Chlamydiia bacterium]|nr:hypothetical protein [Chlamydiia bacterium]
MQKNNCRKSRLFVSEELFFGNQTIIDLVFLSSAISVAGNQLADYCNRQIFTEAKPLASEAVYDSAACKTLRTFLLAKWRALQQPL